MKRLAIGQQRRNCADKAIAGAGGVDGRDGATEIEVRSAFNQGNDSALAQRHTDGFVLIHLQRPGRFKRERLQVLEIGEPFFERHGPRAVFLGRFVLGLRVWASWLAGATRMRWRSFLLWNALGGVCWATAVGLLAYELGHSAGNALQTFGLFGLGAALLGIVAALLLRRRARRRPSRHAARPATAEAAGPHRADDGQPPGSQ